MLELNGLSIGHQGKRFFAPINLKVEKGTVHGLMGDSGMGKSSLIAAIAGLLQTGLYSEGSIRLDGQDLGALPAESRQIGLLFQDDLLFPNLSVAENLSFGMPVLGTPALGKNEERALLIENALASAGLSGFGDSDPARLSGGERARVAMMRLLLSQPKAVLLDEPFSRLDARLRGQFRNFVFDQIRAAQIPALLVSHDAMDFEHSAVVQTWQLEREDNYGS